MHHITNQHEWMLPDENGKTGCLHEPLPVEEVREKPWLDPSKDAAALKALTSLVLDKRLLKKVEYYLNFRYCNFFLINNFKIAKELQLSNFSNKSQKCLFLQIYHRKKCTSSVTFSHFKSNAFYSLVCTTFLCTWDIFVDLLLQ